MHEKKRRVRCELTAIGNGRFECALMSAEPLRPKGRKNLLASDPRYRPSKKSGNNAQNDPHHRFLLRPSPALNEIIVGVLGRAQKKYPIRRCRLTCSIPQ